MKKSIIYGAIFCSLLVASCTKIEDSPADAGNANSPKSSEYAIEINTTRTVGNILGAGPGFGSGPATRAIGDDPFTEIRKVSCFESVVLPELQSHIWIGNILLKSSIVKCEYKPLIYPRMPITVSLTLPGSSPKEIENPSNSNYLSYIQEQIENASFAQNHEFNFTSEQFSSYSELKVAFGSNINTSGIFWGSSSGSSQKDHLISKATGLYVKFYQTSFKAMMDYPQGEIAAIPANLVDSAVYVNSISYGRLGILTLETNETVFEAEDKMTKIFKTIFTNSSTTLTKEEQSFLSGCDFKVYMIGGNGSTSVESFSGLDGFIQHIKKGTFSKDVPGVPIFCTFNYVKDNSPVNIEFDFKIKRNPLYVELVQEPIIPAQGNYNKIRGYGYLRVKFYKNRAKFPEIADANIPIKLKEECICNVYTPNPQGKKETTHSSFVYVGKNSDRETSINTYFYRRQPAGPRQDPIDVYKSIFYMYTFKENRGSRGRSLYRNYYDSPDEENIYKYYLEESDDYVILNTGPLTMENCPLSRKD